MFAISCQQDMPAAGPSRPAEPTWRPASASRVSPGRPPSARSALRGLLPHYLRLVPTYVESDVPSLVLAGSYDPVTPPVWSRTTAEHLPNSTYVEFPGRGHDVTSGNACAATLEALFVTDPTKRSWTQSCVETAPRPSFVLPDDVYRAPGLARSGDDVSIGSPWRSCVDRSPRCREHRGPLLARCDPARVGTGVAGAYAPPNPQGGPNGPGGVRTGLAHSADDHRHSATDDTAQRRLREPWQLGLLARAES